jgi:hypothetical protein
MNVLMIERLILRDSTVSRVLELGFGRVLELVCANWQARIETPARINTSPISVPILSRYQGRLGQQLRHPQRAVAADRVFRGQKCFAPRASADTPQELSRHIRLGSADPGS